MKTLSAIGLGAIVALTFWAGPAIAQGQADEGIYWCPMRGNPCKVEDYHAAGTCNDCKMPLVTKATYIERFSSAEQNAKNVGVVLYEGFELLDVFGPLEMWAYVPEFKLVMVAEQAGPVKSGQGVSVVADYNFKDAPDLDILMVPGGAGTFRELGNEAMLDFLRTSHENAEVTTSVCTGSALLAKAGILDGRKATSNKQFFSLATDQSNKVEWIWEARWVDDGDIITSSGVSAGMDMALHLVSRLYGETTAKAIADGTEYVWQTDPADDPFARMLQPE